MFGTLLFHLTVLVLSPEKETIEHLFLHGEVAAKVWLHFSRAAVINTGLNLKQNIRRWWKTGGNARSKMGF